jgi:hypothetical protein
MEPRLARIGAVVICVLTVLSLYLGVIFWVESPASSLEKSIRPSVSAVLRAQFFARFTGDYWENELDKQAIVIAKLGRAERLEYFKAVLVNCDLHTSKALTFSEIVGNDAESLRSLLLAYKQGAKYQELSEDQKGRVTQWISALSTISVTQQADPTSTKKAAQ